MKKSYRFSAKIWVWTTNQHVSHSGAGWHFVTLPRELFSEIRTAKGKGLIPISVTIGKTSWKTSLLPHIKSQSYLISIKQSVRKQEDLWAGETVHITFRYQ